jgi:hypothetical protein
MKNAKFENGVNLGPAWLCVLVQRQPLDGGFLILILLVSLPACSYLPSLSMTHNTKLHISLLALRSGHFLSSAAPL